MGTARGRLLPGSAPGVCPTSARKASPVLAFLLAALALTGGCGGVGPKADSQLPGTLATPGGPTGAWRIQDLPGDGSTIRLAALARPERTAPARFRVIVVPGSGCAGMGPFAERYFAGLLHAQVLVLHKPGVDPYARRAPDDCSRSFVRQDRLSSWQAHARAALRADAQSQQQLEEGAAGLPQLLVGISEGAELLPALAPEVPRLAGLVLVSSSGLDPREAGALQAERLGAQADWRALGQAALGPLPDGAVLQGRSLGYWRDLWHWPVAQPLLNGAWPVMQVWGEADALVPPAAYERFAQLAAGRAAPWCARRLEGADHGLQVQATGSDGVQRLWAWLEQWARAPGKGLCAPLGTLR